MKSHRFPYSIVFVVVLVIIDFVENSLIIKSRAKYRHLVENTNSTIFQMETPTLRFLSGTFL